MHIHLLVCVEFHPYVSFLGFAREQRESALPSAQESVESILCLTQAILLASFAVILSAHQSDILDKKSENNSSLDCNDSVSYSPPTVWNIVIFESEQRIIFRLESGLALNICFRTFAPL